MYVVTGKFTEIAAYSVWLLVPVTNTALFLPHNGVAQG